MSIKKQFFTKTLIFTFLLTMDMFCENITKKPTILPIPKSTKATPNKKEDTEHVLTFFIHGTIIPIPSFTALGKTIKGKSDKTKRTKGGFFKKYRHNLRFSGIHKFQPMDKLGLVKFDLNKKNKYSKSSCEIIESYKTIHNDLYPDNKNNLVFYTFGWDGTLDHKKRVHWSKKLYKALQKEIATVKKRTQPSNIKVEIIAHSHGGNVALSLANIEKELKQDLCIDNLVLLATPIQCETEDLIYSDVFKNIYNIYSTGDMVQIADVISTKDSRSKRIFQSKEGKKLPSKLTQIQVKVENKNPLHNEFWLLGGDYNLVYREKLAIYPFPLVVFTPIVTNLVENKIKNASSLKLQITKAKELDSYKFIFDDKTSSKYYTSYNSSKLKSLIH